MAGLLGDIYSFGDGLKRRLRGLLSDPVGSMQQALDHALPTQYEAQQGLLALRGQPYNPDAVESRDRKMENVALNFNPGAIGQIVWHGSPHKFDKFDMSKIGTGEGAQAYGHGLYMAESPDVAKQYSRMGKIAEIDGVTVTGKGVAASNTDAAKKLGINQSSLDRLALSDFDVQKTLKELGDEYASAANHGERAYVMQQIGDMKRLRKSNLEIKGGNLYKTDIPDEAVARFLDWDKPLSQQAPEVKKALKSIGVEIDDGVSVYQGPKGKWIADNGQKMSIFNSEAEALQSVPQISGKDIWNRLKSTIPLDKSDALNQAGIPGIRYLDGGSRSAGQGSSNFVLFDDQMPRILEINGKPTGQVPWKPKEWGLLSP